MKAQGDLSPEQAVARLADGELVGFPTETSWGLAADARSPAAMEALRAFKGRDADKPVAVLVTDLAAALRAGATPGPGGRRLAAALWPGPLTLVLPCSGRFAPGVAGADGRVGFRCSPHPAARALAERAAAAGVGPLTATSLNASGAPDCRSRAEARRAAGGRVPLLAGPDTGGGPSSTVVLPEDGTAKILREGAIPADAIATVLRGDDPR